MRSSRRSRLAFVTTTAVALLLLGLTAQPVSAVSPGTTVVDDCQRWGPTKWWIKRTNTAHGYARDYLVTQSAGRGRKAVNGCEWIAKLPGGSGRFHVEAFIPKREAVASTVYYVRHNGGQARVTIDQRRSQGWVRLGTYDINGPKGSVGVNDATGTRGDLIGFDAIRWRRVINLPSTLRTGQRLRAGQQMWSGNGKYRLVMQGDGNLVLYKKGTGALWASKTNGRRGAYAVMQGDGNFVVYAGGKPWWASKTHGHRGARLVLQNDGNLVVYDRNGKARWASNTRQQPGDSRPFDWIAGYENTAQGNSNDGTLADCDVDQWLFCRRNCTSYVAYRLNRAGIGFTNYYKDQRWGHARNWDDVARRVGIPTGTTPRVGAVAYWNQPYGGGYGHVAWVEGVNADGSVRTSNWNGLTEKPYRRSSARPHGYIYFK